MDGLLLLLLKLICNTSGQFSFFNGLTFEYSNSRHYFHLSNQYCYINDWLNEFSFPLLQLNVEYDRTLKKKNTNKKKKPLLRFWPTLKPANFLHKPWILISRLHCILSVQLIFFFHFLLIFSSVCVNSDTLSPAILTAIWFDEAHPKSAFYSITPCV